jgi:addiction module HigA family antidote
MLSDLGSPQVTAGHQPVVDRIEDDESEIVAQLRPHRDDTKSKEADLGGTPPPKPPPQQARNAAPAGSVPVAATTAGRGDVQRTPTAAELQAAVEKREKQAFEQAAQQVRDAVGNDPQLAELARLIEVPANRVSQILAGKRAITADTALRLAQYFGMSADFWMNLQKILGVKLLMSTAEHPQTAGCRCMQTQGKGEASPSPDLEMQRVG